MLHSAEATACAADTYHDHGVRSTVAEPCASSFIRSEGAYEALDMEWLFIALTWYGTGP